MANQVSASQTPNLV